MNQKRSIITTVVLIGVLLISILLVSSVSQDVETKDPLIRKIVYDKLEENNEIPVIIKLKERKQKGLFSKFARDNDIESRLMRKKAFDKSRDIIYIKATKEDILELEKENDIESIEYAFLFKKNLQNAVNVMNFTQSWNAQSASINITGLDETICIIDSGVNFSHPDLVGKNRTCIIDCFNKACVENCSIGDDDAHGTHVAGIISATGGIKGVAPNSTLIGVKVLNSSGSAHHVTGADDIANAIDWCIAQRDTHNISVISMSLGSSGLFSSYCDSSFSSTMTPSINNATKYNISVIAASGNDGSSTGIASPACIQNSTAVAATTKANVMASYSDRNSLIDLLATGSSINSTRYDPGGCDPLCTCSGNYMICSGTSMATPMVAGAFALIRQFNRLQNNQILTPQQIENTFNSTGYNVADAGSGLNYSRIDVLSALYSLGYKSPREATIAFMGDARPYNVGDGSSQLQNDLNATDDSLVIGSGRLLDAIVFVGDMDYVNYSAGRNTEEAHNGSDIRNVPRFYGLGNHEIDDTYDIDPIRKYFASYNYTPNPGPLGTESTTYSFDKGDMHIVMINPYWDGDNNGDCAWFNNVAGDNDDVCMKYSTSDGGYITDELFEWLKSDLRNSTKPYKIVASHEPAYPLYRHVGDSLDANITNRDKFWNLLRTEKVIAHMTAHTHRYVFNEYDGVFEINNGVSGRMVGGSYDPYAAVIYAHTDTNGNFEIRTAREEPSWANPNISTFTRINITNQTLINSWAGAGTVSKYFIDRNNSDQANPNWTAYNNSQWWSLGFNESATNWSDGELGTGYDSTNPNAWGWINENISVNNGTYGIFQRINFTAYSKSIYNRMILGLDYDDSIIVWLNGVKIYESDNAPIVSSGDIWDKNASSQNSSLGDESYSPNFNYIDITGYIGNLNDGENLIAIGNWNVNLSSTDLISAAKLVIQQVDAPEVIINTPTAVTYTSSLIIFNVTLDEDGYCEYSLDDGSTNITMSSTDNRTWNASQTISDGSYTARFYCNDSSGYNNYTETVSFGVSTAPIVQNNGGNNGGGGTPTGVTYVPSFAEVVVGYSKGLSADDKVKFKQTPTGIDHTLTLNSIVNTQSVNITIQSTPITFILQLGEEKKINLNNNGYYDLSVKLSSILNSKANIAIKTIKELINEIVITNNNTNNDSLGDDPFKKENPKLKPNLVMIIFYFVVIIIVIFLIVLIVFMSTKNKKLKDDIKNKTKQKEKSIKNYKQVFNNHVRPKDVR
ncbi:S8 family serine peptidase [Candidatus Pacearchaeota archaeon]|nr:S8 family serine peptidase [Candidatus Pacearchaeota archaeon]